MALLGAGLAVLSEVRKDGVTRASVQVRGQEKTVFDWSQMACEAGDYPDLPARAFRDSSNRVQLIASHVTTRRTTGDTLTELRHTCEVVMGSDFQADPAAFNDAEWISATWTADGNEIFALVHDEYHGQDHADACPATAVVKSGDCLYNGITQAVSHDGGRTYLQSDPPQLVASVPYRYVPGAGPYGAFSPSNIVHNGDDGYYYTFLHVEDYAEQKRGACPMRTRTPADPGSWRGWDGSSFANTFINPYREPSEPAEDHICRPVAYDRIQKMYNSLTYSTYYDKFMLVGTAAKFDAGERRPIWGFYFSLSDDLIHWSDRELIKEVELPWTFECGDQDPVQYPSLIDPSSRDRNFQTIGPRPFLFFTRHNYKNCELGPDRDLLRVRLEFSK